MTFSILKFSLKSNFFNFFIEIHLNVKPTELERHGGKMMRASAKNVRFYIYLRIRSAIYLMDTNLFKYE